MADRRKIVSVIGDANIEEGGEKYRLAFQLGKALVDAGYRVQSGGMKGVMRAAMAGARSSKRYKEGDTIALIPSFDAETANEFADIAIPTGLDLMRNAMVANAYAVVGIGGGAGTMSEYCFAWTMKRLIIAFKNSGGWSEKVADTRIDERTRYPHIPDDRVYGVTTAEEAVRILDEKIDIYTQRHQGIIGGGKS